MSAGGPVPSTLDDLLVYVRALLVQCGQADFPHVNGSGFTEVLIGERYDQGEGASNQILFIPTEEGGALGPPLHVSSREIGSIGESCVCYVWGSETTADATRYQSARALVMRLMACFNVAAPGMITWGRETRSAGTDITTFGEEFRLVITYTWAVPRDAAVDAAARVLGPVTSGLSDPDRPNGSNGNIYGIVVTPNISR